MSTPDPNLPQRSALDTPPEWSETLFTYLHRGRVLLKQFAWVFLLTVSLSMGLQAYKMLTLPTVYISDSQMIVNGRIAMPDGAVYREELSNFFGTQISLMQSNMVRTRAQDRVLALNPALKPSNVAISVVQSPNASIFLLQAQGENPDYTTAYLNAVMQEYLSFKAQMRSQTTESTFVSITDKVLQLKEEIDVLEEKKLAFQRENNLVFVQEQGNAAGKQLAQLQDKLDNLKVKERSLKALNLETFFNQPVTAELEQIITNADYQIDYAEYVKLSSELEHLKAQCTELLVYMKENHPTIINLKTEITKRENAMRVVQRQCVQDLIDRRESITYEISNLEKVVDEWRAKALDFSQRMGEFDQIESKLERLKRSQEQLLASTQSIEINKNLDQESVAILENASKATTAPKNYPREIFIGLCLGLFLGGGIIFGIGAIDTRIYSADDISERYEEPILGILPALTEIEANQLLKRNDERAIFAEANRNIRSSLLYMGKEETTPSAFLITSSVPGEGKSTIASNLAIALAFSSAKVILIDADLRRGHLSEKFKLNKSPGLSEAIAENRDIESVIQKTGIEALDFVATGHYPDNPSELFLTPYIDALFLKLRKEYDYIIVDSAPILATNDTLNLSPKLDGILYVMRSALTRTRQVKSALQTLSMHNQHIFGFILNSVEARGQNYYYYKYREYH